MPDKENTSSMSSEVNSSELNDDFDGVYNEKFDIDNTLDHLKSQYNMMDSSATTEISNIEGIIFGALSSRFWLFRKHMICMDY